MKIDLTTLPSGVTYEDRYSGYLNIFEQVARTPKEVAVEIINCPPIWAALFAYLNCDPIHLSVEDRFRHDDVARSIINTKGTGNLGTDRTLVETLCTLRPETIDALWKVDCEWPGNRPSTLAEKEFIVTTNAAFSRPEVMKYLEVLRTYTPTKKKCVLVPCAADKPYPSPLHKAVAGRFPSDDWYLAIVTGVCGVVPRDLWGIMPHYDSGIPNRWRVFQEVNEYFTRHKHDVAVCYSDFYAGAIQLGLMGTAVNRSFLFEPHIKDVPGYEPLLDEGNLDRLGAVMRDF